MIRDDAIVFMAAKVWPNDYKMTPLVTTELVEAHLDALLDFLTAHADEWVDAYPITQDGLRGAVGRNLVAMILPKAIQTMRRGA